MPAGEVGHDIGTGLCVGAVSEDGVPEQHDMSVHGRRIVLFMPHLRQTAVATVRHHVGMAASGPPVARLKAAIAEWAAWIREADREALADGLLLTREAGIVPLEAAF